MHVSAIERKRLADTLKDGKELPAYLKAMGLYALAYSQYELFGPVLDIFMSRPILTNRMHWKSGKACWSLVFRLRKSVPAIRMT